MATTNAINTYYIPATSWTPVLAFGGGAFEALTDTDILDNSQIMITCSYIV